MSLIFTKRVVIVMAAFLFLTFASCSTKQSAEESEEGTEEVAEDTTATEEEPEADAPIASPREKAEGTVDGVGVTVDYGSPAVKDRTIWGGLEEYGVVWRAGANETTSVEFGEDVEINGTTVPAGKYGLYVIPNENADWVVIFNSDWDREKHGAWGAYNYTEENDVVRVEVTPEWVEDVQERLQYAVTEGGIDFAWEKARFTIPLSKAASAE